MYLNSNVRKLVSLYADLKSLSRTELKSTKKVGKDDKKYYVIGGSIEATYYSAQTKYILEFKGKFI
jgi:hypothetical protein